MGVPSSGFEISSLASSYRHPILFIRQSCQLFCETALIMRIGLVSCCSPRLRTGLRASFFACALMAVRPDLQTAGCWFVSLDTAEIVLRQNTISVVLLYLCELTDLGKYVVVNSPWNLCWYCVWERKRGFGGNKCFCSLVARALQLQSWPLSGFYDSRLHRHYSPLALPQTMCIHSRLNYKWWDVKWWINSLSYWMCVCVWQTEHLSESQLLLYM